MKLLVLTLLVFGATVFADNGCWRPTYGRGVGKVITDCHVDEEKNGALCYPKCKDGFYGVGPVCWQYCPPDFTDIGVGCQKPSSYGRGAGYTSESSCDGHSDTGCEKWGLLWYPKCKEGFHNAACCVCSPSCPNGLIDSGVTCTKQSYGRGAGKPLICAPGLEEQASLCYKPCADNYYGDGPGCWHSCPNGLIKCGALCLESEKACFKEVLNIAEEVASTVVEIAKDPKDALQILAETVAKIGSELKYPICDNMN